MWQCHKCSKPVYFAERKQSLGYDWHPECLRCEECGKRLNPGQHAEHKSIPYCHIPCYAALFGPQLFGHGTQVESHKSFGAKGSTPRTLSGGQMLYTRDAIETKLKQYNEYFDNKSQEIRSREVNGRMVLEGCLKVYWGVQSMIHLKEDDDQRTVITVRKRNSCRYSNSTEFNSDRNLIAQENVNSNQTSADVSTISLGDGGDTTDISMTESFSFDTCSVNEDVQSLTSSSSSKEISPDHHAATLPIKLNNKNIQRDEIDELLQVERQVDDNGKLYRTLPNLSDKESSFDSNVACLSSSQVDDIDDDKSVASSISSTSISNSTDNNSTLTNKLSDDAYQTPMNSLKSADFDDFKVQIQKEFFKNASLLQSISDDTLKSRQPIDPSRINDSLKLYTENMMSNSLNGDFDSMICNKINQLSPTNCVDVVNRLSLDTVSSTSDLTISTTSGANGIAYSKFDPDRYRIRKKDESDDDSTTLRPTTMKKRTINIKMNCYDGLGNCVSSTSAELNTPTIPNNSNNGYDDNEYAVVLRQPKTGSTAIKRRSGNRRMRTKLKRRCSINGHFYNRETSFFTPPHGSQMSVWASSLVSTSEVVNLLLEKYKVDSRPENFSLFVVRDNGEQRRLKDDEYPLLVRILLGPHEDVARLFLTDAYNTAEISCEVAQFINLSIQECRAILDRYEDEQIREIQKIKQKYSDFRQKIIQRMESLKVRL